MAIHRLANLAIFVLALATVGCDFGGISRAKAIDIATNGDPASAISAEHGPLGRFANSRTLPEVPRTREVWAVRISGRFPFSCPYHANMANCPADATTMLVVLDFRTGEGLFSEAPAP
jgi:hypothetical protein